MALSVVHAGSSNGTTSTGSLSVASVNAAVGDLIVVAIAAANSGTSGVSPLSGCSDGGTNTFTKRGEVTQSPGSASGDGATFSWYTAPVTGALTGATITVSFSPNVAHKAMTVYVVSCGGGETIDTPTASGGATGASASPSVTKGSVATGSLIFGGFSVETDDGITADSDTTNGNWSTKIEEVGDAGADASAQTCVTQYKLATGTGGQTYNPTITGGASRDWAGAWLEVTVSSSGPTYTLDSNAGAITLAGTNASLELFRNLNANAGAVTLAGQDCALTRSLLLNASAGAVTLVGQSADLMKVFTLNANAGAISLAGQDVAFTFAHLLNSSAGAITLAGQDCAFVASRSLVPQAGAVTLAGTNASLELLRNLNASAGAITLAGTSAALLQTYLINSSAGAVALAGQDAVLTYQVPNNYDLVCFSGEIALTGEIVEFVYDGATYSLVCEGAAIALTADAMEFIYSELYPKFQIGVVNDAEALFVEDGHFISGVAKMEYMADLTVALRTAIRGEGRPGHIMMQGLMRTHAEPNLYNGFDVRYIETQDNALYPHVWIDPAMWNIDNFYTFNTDSIDEFELISTSGTISVTADDAMLGWQRFLDCDGASIALAGADVTFTTVRVFDCESGAIAITGDDAILFYGKSLNSNSGAITLAGQNCAFTRSAILNASAGAISLLGENLDLLKARVLACNGGEIVLASGDDLSFESSTSVNVDVLGLGLNVELGTINAEGDYIASLPSVDVDLGYFWVWGIIPDGQTPGWVEVDDTQTPNWN